MANEMIMKVKADMKHDGHEIMVRKSNDLIQKSRFNLSVPQQRIIAYLLSQISPNDEEFKLYDFTISEFCRVCGIEYNGKNLNDLKAAIKDLADKSMWVYVGEETQTLVRWVEKPFIHEGTGTVQIKLDRDMIPFLLQLKERYTQYELIYALRFKSKYSIRLYELIKSRHYHEMEEYSFSYTVEELRQRLNAESYTQYKNLKMRILEPAIREINAKSDIELEWVESPPARRGVRVLSIEFTVRPKAAVERMKIRDEIERELGWDQIALW